MINNGGLSLSKRSTETYAAFFQDNTYKITESLTRFQDNTYKTTESLTRFRLNVFNI